jgi:hypothetical protein
MRPEQRVLTEGASAAASGRGAVGYAVGVPASSMVLMSARAAELLLLKLLEDLQDFCGLLQLCEGVNQSLHFIAAAAGNQGQASKGE